VLTKAFQRHGGDVVGLQPASLVKGTVLFAAEDIILDVLDVVQDLVPFKRLDVHDLAAYQRTFGIVLHSSVGDVPVRTHRYRYIVAEHLGQRVTARLDLNVTASRVRQRLRRGAPACRKSPMRVRG
jgi:hypothetical protein